MRSHADQSSKCSAPMSKPPASRNVSVRTRTALTCGAHVRRSQNPTAPGERRCVGTSSRTSAVPSTTLRVMPKHRLAWRCLAAVTRLEMRCGNATSSSSRQITYSPRAAASPWLRALPTPRPGPRRTRTARSRSTAGRVNVPPSSTRTTSMFLCVSARNDASAWWTWAGRVCVVTIAVTSGSMDRPRRIPDSAVSPRPRRAALRHGSAHVRTGGVPLRHPGVPLRHPGCTTAPPGVYRCATGGVPLRHRRCTAAPPAVYHCATRGVPLRHPGCTTAPPGVYHCATRGVPLRHRRCTTAPPGVYHCATQGVPLRHRGCTAAPPGVYHCATGAQRCSTAVDYVIGELDEL